MKAQVILANGPLEMLRRAVVGELVFSFMCAIGRRQDWMSPGAAIDPKEYLPPMYKPETDPMTSELADLGMEELQRRSVELLEAWQEDSMAPGSASSIGFDGDNAADANKSTGAGKEAEEKQVEKPKDVPEQPKEAEGRIEESVQPTKEIVGGTEETTPRKVADGESDSWRAIALY
jgi:hypothetical protein